jgi:glycopeptide antibiotics resistance protein
MAVVTLVGVAMQQLSPFTLGGTPRAFQWMPFRNYYDFTTSETVSHSAELLLAYLPLGFALALAARGAAARWIVVTASALAIATPIEYLQQFVGGRFPDVTDIAMSVLGAWLGAWTATRGWALFSDEVRIIAQSVNGGTTRSDGARPLYSTAGIAAPSRTGHRSR